MKLLDPGDASTFLLGDALPDAVILSAADRLIAPGALLGRRFGAEVGVMAGEFGTRGF